MSPIPHQPAERFWSRWKVWATFSSDMHAFLGHDERLPAPLILGHEVAGTITGGARMGDRMTINPLSLVGYVPFVSLDKIIPVRRVRSFQWSIVKVASPNML